MQKLRDSMIFKDENGNAWGDKEEINKAISREYARTNQPKLTYVEKYALRDEVMENAKLYGNVREAASDMASYGNNLYELPKAQQLVEIDRAIAEAGKRGDYKQVAQLGKLKGAIEDAPAGAASKFFKAWDSYQKASDAYGYYEGYRAAGNSQGMAVLKAGTQMGVKTAIDTAVKNPVVGLMDTGFKYITKAYDGQDRSPSKWVETMVNIGFDKATGELDRKPIERLDLGGQEIQDVVRQSHVRAVEKQLSNPYLEHEDRIKLSEMLANLKKG